MGLKKILKKLYFLSKKKELIPILQPISESKLLEGKIALIIGGSGGIGFAIAKSFVASGAKVILAARHEDKLEVCKEQLKEGESDFICIDLEKTGTFAEKVFQTANIFGRIDILVNAAGTHTPCVDFWSVDEKEYNRVLNTNLRGSYFLIREVAGYMRKNGIKGHILIICSATSNEPAWSPYRISKTALKGMMEGLAKILLQSGITVNAISPNSVATELNGYASGTPINSDACRCKRLVMPEEVAEYAKLFVSGLGDMAVGSTLFLSGGRGVFDFR